MTWTSNASSKRTPLSWHSVTGFQEYLHFAETIDNLYELHNWFIFFHSSILVQLVIRWLQQW